MSELSELPRARARQHQELRPRTALDHVLGTEDAVRTLDSIGGGGGSQVHHVGSLERDPKIRPEQRAPVDAGRDAPTPQSGLKVGDPRPAESGLLAQDEEPVRG